MITFFRRQLRPITEIPWYPLHACIGIKTGDAGFCYWLRDERRSLVQINNGGLSGTGTVTKEFDTGAVTGGQETVSGKGAVTETVSGTGAVTETVFGTGAVTETVSSTGAVT